MFDPQLMAQSLVEATKAYVGRALETMTARLSDLDARIKAIPAGQAGKDGADGAAGADGRDGAAGADGKDGAAGTPGSDGAAGADGAAGLPGRDGANGKDGAAGKDGASGSPGEPGEPGRDGREGEKGRDALQLEVLDGIDPSKSYLRNTCASHRGGVIRSFRATDPVTDSLEKSGWHVIVEGIAEESETLNGRVIERTTVYTSGRKSVRKYTTKAMEYRLVWKEGESYEPGDVVTWSGSAWHCEAVTKDKPGTSTAFRLMVKSGRDGKDGKDGAQATKTLRLS